ncbi:DUF2380 domain-containing protein [Tenacibaculum piscium]|uniref:DUF2380 domain-containing protein n=1 Tax=Tenacibaculum piscium TaxID=1458515 RepID=UPI00187B9D40|nr:DUF2380 domain-containing protein [Tenacibaculum piscium]MBE7671694.1 DUF2380 domain-containing protein [Tenacibaculum piscium]
MKIKIIGFLLIALSLMSCSEGTEELHHVYPQKYRMAFKRAGIDIDTKTISVTKEVHRIKKGNNIHTKLMKEWDYFFKKNPNATKKQMEKFMQKTLTSRGVSGIIELKDYKSKLGTGSILTLSDNWFLKQSYKIGTSVIRLLGSTSWGVAILNFLAAIGTIILGIFGIKTGRTTAVGVGLIALIIGIPFLIGAIYALWLFATWVIMVVIPLILGSVFGIDLDS